MDLTPQTEDLIDAFSNLNSSSIKNITKRRPFIFKNTNLKLQNENSNPAFFYSWLCAAYAPTSQPLAIAPYKMCPLAGRDKYLLFRAGYSWGLSPGFSGRFKYHRRDTLRKAFFKACANYWRVRRCIMRWKHRRMQERSSLEIIASGESMHTVPKTMWYSLIDNNQKYTFYIRDLIRLMHERLLNSEFFIMEPLRPTNPLTGTELSNNQIHCILMRCIALHIALPWSVIAFWKLMFNLSEFLSNNYVCLNEIAIKAEAFSMNHELVDDIEAMYDSFNLEHIRPCVDDARRLKLVPVLIKTHQLALHSFFLAQRSLCKYTQELAQKNIIPQCIDASNEYHKRTQLTLFRDCMFNAFREDIIPNNDSNILRSNLSVTFRGPNNITVTETPLSPEAYDTAEEVDSP